MLDRISHLERLTNSSYGNPRYRVHFRSRGTGANYVPGISAITTSDAGFCYGLTNRENLDNPVRVEFTRAGRIAGITPVTDDEAKSMRMHPATAHLFD